MLLTKECDYAIRIVRALSSGTKKTIEQITDGEKIPQKYAYKVIKKLVQAGFVYSTRGRVGGYHLVKPLDGFSMHDIVNAVDAERYISDCVKPGAKCSFVGDGEGKCSVHTELLRIQAVVAAELSQKTMAEILNLKDDAKAI